jgi:hypothetical protein
MNKSLDNVTMALKDGFLLVNDRTSCTTNQYLQEKGRECLHELGLSHH